MIGRGIVNAHVYLDHDGDLIFNEEIDEPLAEVMVQSLNARKRSDTDENGYAVLTGLSPGVPTDIIINQDTLPDHLMVPGRPGRSILPLGGQRHDFDIPIHMAGEVDGTTYLKTTTGEKKNIGRFFLQLHPIDGRSSETIDAQVAFDGFYLFSKVPPGRYLLTPKPPKNKKSLGNPTPEIITITYKGDIVPATDLLFKENRGFVEYDIISELDENHITNFASDLSYEYSMALQSKGKSSLGTMLQGLMMKMYGNNALDGLSKTNQTIDGYDIYSGSKQDLHDACGKLIMNNISCKMRITVKDTAGTKVSDSTDIAKLDTNKHN